MQTSPNIALEAHAVRAADWNGMTCMLFQRPSPERTPGQDRQLTFKCNMTGSFSGLLHKVSMAHGPSPLTSSSFSLLRSSAVRTCEFLLLQSTIVEASLQLPQSLLVQAAVPGQPDDAVYKLHLLGFRNGKFFPSTGNSSQLADGGKRRSVATPVIMAKLGEANDLRLHVRQSSGRM